MKLDQALARNDGTVHQFCLSCGAEAIERAIVDDRTYYDCGVCGRRSERSLVIDPAVRWWVDETGEYWHESTGVFLRRGDRRFLFFRRTIFPFALTVPSGHVDVADDSPATAAVRELVEETGVELPVEALRFVGTEEVWGDECRRGADVHRWHAYVAVTDAQPRIVEEGDHPLWLSLDEALTEDLIVPVRFIINRHRSVLVDG